MYVVKTGSTPTQITFECPRCGCIFTANRGEYRYRKSEQLIMYYACRCPECRFVCEKDEEDE